MFGVTLTRRKNGIDGNVRGRLLPWLFGQLFGP
jgi:hypothetical protein